MAIVVGTPATAENTSANTLSLACPGSEGDVVVAYTIYDRARTWSSGMSGWTEIGSNWTGTQIYSRRIRTWWKVRGASESDLSFSMAETDYMAIVALPLSGVDESSIPTTFTKTDYGSTAIKFQGATTTVDNSLVVKIQTGRNCDAFDAPRSTQLFFATDHESIDTCAGYEAIGSAGAVAEETIWTDSLSRSHSAVSLVFAPAAASAPSISSVTLTGTSQIGNTLTATVVTDQDPVDSTTYQWEKASDGSGTGAADISGETSSTLALTYADFGDLLDTAAYVRCGAIATKNALPSDEAFSAWQQVTAPSGGVVVRIDQPVFIL